MMFHTNVLPKFMKAVQATAYGDDMDALLSVHDKVPVPSLDDEYQPTEPIHPLIQKVTREDRKTHLIVKTLAVALAPGDCRVLSGQTREFQGPPRFPYVPGGDCCGVVCQTSETETYFQPGDLVAARFTLAPRDALGEYARVSAKVCEKVDSSLSAEEAAALVSASPAVCLCDDQVRPNERILVLGAGGGVGSHFCQVARNEGGASYVCGVSSTPERLLQEPIHCDDAIDYTKENLWESIKYQQEPFDTIYDFASGGWPQLVQSVWRQRLPSIVKPASQGGRYVTLTPDTPTFEGHSFLGTLGMFVVKPFFRNLWSRLPFVRNKMPKFLHTHAIPETRDILTRTLDLAKQGKLRAVVDGPYPMTTEGVRKAFGIQKSRHGKGKVVIQVAKQQEQQQQPPAPQQERS